MKISIHHLTYLKYFFSLLFVSNGVIAVGQTIRSSDPLVFPISPSISYVVESGQTLNASSSSIVTLKPGTHFKSGSNIWIRIDPTNSVPSAPSNPIDNNEMNWVATEQFNASGEVIAQNKSFYNKNGNILQMQYKDIDRGHVLASQVIYDAAGRPALETLPAAINNSAFSYNSNFVQNAGGGIYDYSNFDKLISGDKTLTPDPIGGKQTLGTLGWYYSENNAWEPYQDITDYPYKRQSYSYDGSGIATKLGGPGDQFRLGNGKEGLLFSIPAKEELENYWLVRNHFFSEAEVGAKLDGTSSSNNAIMKIGIDADGAASFTIGMDGNVLVTGSSGSETTITKTISASEVSYFGIMQATSVTFTPINGRVLNMATGKSFNVTASSLSLSPGWYVFENSGVNTMIKYSVGVKNLAYNFYNQLGQLIGSIAPEGVKKLKSGSFVGFTKENMPFITLFKYDRQGRLISQKSPDEKWPTEIVYRRDGKARFSQDAKQKVTGRYSYSTYDNLGRIIESGEYLPENSGIFFNAIRGGNSPMEGILENTDLIGGLVNGTKFDVVRFKYGETDLRHSQTNFKQDSYYLRGHISTSEKYSSIINNIPNEQNLISRSWYNYTSEGLVDWHIKYVVGLGYKTTDYTYDEFGAIEKKVYQRHVPSEFMAYYYEYDKDRRLAAVYSNTVDNPNSKLVQARYQYYLHGPLKRVELADNLQGIDYVYTADGRLKSVNNPNPLFDPGKDSISNKFAKDVFGYSLEYFTGDYKRANTDIKSMQTGSTRQYFVGIINGVLWSSKVTSVLGSTRFPYMTTFVYGTDYNLSSNNFGTPNFATSSFVSGGTINQEKGLTYDGNGNIKSLIRTNAAGKPIHNYVYNYEQNTNKLSSITNYASYTYDDIGQMSSQIKGGVGMYFDYDVSGKLIKIYSDEIKKTLIISYLYDDGGIRVMKKDHRTNMSTWYSYDDKGKLSGIFDQQGVEKILLKEQPIYGQERIGTFYRSGNISHYILADHLGNTRVVINRNKLANGAAEVVYYADYYPFGMEIRSGGIENRYGYQGWYAEKDKETAWNNFELRNYDPTIGRWLTVDPQGVENSSYAAMANLPTMTVDPNGGIPVFVVGGIIGGVVGGTISVATQYHETGKISWSRVGSAAVFGAVAGAGGSLGGGPGFGAIVGMIGETADIYLDKGKIERDDQIKILATGGVGWGVGKFLAPMAGASFKKSAYFFEVKNLESSIIRAAKSFNGYVTNSVGNKLVSNNAINAAVKAGSRGFLQTSYEGMSGYVLQTMAKDAIDRNFLGIKSIFMPPIIYPYQPARSYITVGTPTETGRWIQFGSEWKKQ